MPLAVSWAEEEEGIREAIGVWLLGGGAAASQNSEGEL
jgi:hypothetical protein